MNRSARLMLPKYAEALFQLPYRLAADLPIAQRPGCNLRLTQDSNGAIVFLGVTHRWKPTGIALRKDRLVHSLRMAPVPTFAFTNSLSTFSPPGKAKVGEGKAVHSGRWHWAAKAQRRKCPV